MNKSILIIISIVGIFVAGISGMFYEQLRPIPTSTNIPNYLVDTNASIEFSDLKPAYVIGQPIEFSILAHKFSGCSTIHLMIFNKFKTQPPIYEQDFYPPCTESSKIKPDEYSFSVNVNLNYTRERTYVVVAEYYQNRASYGNIEQTFQTVNLTDKDVVPRGDLFAQQHLRIEGLNQTQHVGQKIEFIVKYNGTKSGCDDYPTLRIEDSNHRAVWNIGRLVTLCDPDLKPHHYERVWKIGDTPLSSPMINKTGFYTLFAEFENDIVQHDFWVKASLQPENVMDVDGKSFYYFTINDILNSVQGEGKKINFQNVTFTLFPRPLGLSMGGFCNGGSFGTSIKFFDGTRELLKITTPEKACMSNFSKSDFVKLTNHTNPQAGLTFFDNSVRLLVSSDSENTTSHIQTTNQREMTILSISPQNVTLPEPKKQTAKTTCNAGVCFTPE